MSAGTVPVSALEFMDALHGMAQDPDRWVDAIDAIERLHPLPDDDLSKPLLMSFAQRAVDLAERGPVPVSAVETSGGRVLSGLLVSPRGLVRGVSGRAVEKLRPFLLSPPEAFTPLRFARRWNEAFSTALSVASSGKNGGYAHLRLERDGGESVFVVLMNRRVFPAEVYRMFGLAEGGQEPLLALLVMGESADRAQDARDAPILGLTPAEWRLALELREGVAVSDAALALGISVNTARTQVKSIFSKLGISRQSELVRRLEGYEVLRPAARAPQAADTSPSRRFAKVATGRHVAFREYGDMRGRPILFFHQWFASSLLPIAAQEAVVRSGLRLIAMDRPGFGQSQMSTPYSFDTVARDALAMADSLGLQSFSLMAVAPGAPFAVALALLAPDRVERMALVAPRLFPVQQDNQRRGRLARGLAGVLRHPWTIRPLVRVMRSTAGERLSSAMLRHVRSESEWDKEALADPQVIHSIVQMGCDAHESSAEGFIAELELFSRGLFPEAARVGCPVSVWHGAHDPLALLDHTLSVFGEHGKASMNVLAETGAVFGPAAYAKVFGWLAD
jgi:pimeloyl-ACP methyl ester carboxylesterase/DNA-binding CsgD family transcriptional regulator